MSIVYQCEQESLVTSLEGSLESEVIVLKLDPAVAHRSQDEIREFIVPNLQMRFIPQTEDQSISVARSSLIETGEGEDLLPIAIFLNPVDMGQGIAMLKMLTKTEMESAKNQKGEALAVLTESDMLAADKILSLTARDPSSWFRG